MDVPAEKQIDFVLVEDGLNVTERFRGHGPVLVRQAHNPRGNLPVHCGEVSADECELVLEEGVVARVEVCLCGEDDKVREPLIERVVASGARARVRASAKCDRVKTSIVPFEGGGVLFSCWRSGSWARVRRQDALGKIVSREGPCRGAQRAGLVIPLKRHNGVRGSVALHEIHEKVALHAEEVLLRGERSVEGSKKLVNFDAAAGHSKKHGLRTKSYAQSYT